MQMLRKAHWQPRIELEYCVYVFCDKMQNLQSIFTYFRVSCLVPTQSRNAALRSTKMMMTGVVHSKMLRKQSTEYCLKKLTETRNDGQTSQISHQTIS